MATVNYSFGPIPQKRGRWREVLVCALVGLYVIYFVWKLLSMDSENLTSAFQPGLNRSTDVQYVHMYHHVYAMMMSFCGAFLGKAISCLCVCVEEIRHTKSRYGNSILMAIKSSFEVFFRMGPFAVTALIIVVAISMKMIDEELFLHHHTRYWPIFTSSIGVALITDYGFGYKTLSTVEISMITESSKMDVAQGLAWSYFTGYLKLILPNLKDTISKDDHWKTEMEANNLPCKFFAIVPLNCIIPGKLGECPERHQGIEHAGKLPTLYIDRAGVQKRPYQNSVYKITDGQGHNYWAICEYVTPVDTLLQMSTYGGLDRKLREEECRLLVRTLEEIVDADQDCRRLCKIVTLSGDDRSLLRDALITKIQEERIDMP